MLQNNGCNDLVVGFSGWCDIVNISNAASLYNKSVAIKHSTFMRTMHI